ncbi:E3 ubiquitin-protein ligase IPI1 isoform X2 [Primulina huaijiensis]|uniref:E3 ubiquitin-protein ligase IPI1 isoform X2 n=1 Tax=Primulina huaijiensis TaxID=1492673 RepID=UPI003CC78DA1
MAVIDLGLSFNAAINFTSANCIGSAFNIKGAMQCPNCRKIEKGQWLYANGSRPLPEFNMEDWAHDEDLYDLGYSEMSFGVHWCPFSGLTRIPASFDEGEFSSSASHPCPYITYFGPVHPSSTSSGSVSDGSSFHNHWSGPSVQSEVPSSYGFPSMDAHYHGWAHSPPFAIGSRSGAADQPSIPSVNQRAARNGSDVPRPGMLPFIVGHSSGSRAPSSVTTSVIPHYPGIVARPRDHAPSLQAYFPQSNDAPMARTPLVSTGRRSSRRRGLAQVVPLNSSSDQSSGIYFSSNSSGRTVQEPENTRQDQFHAWDGYYQPSVPLNPIDRDSMWGPFHPPAGGSETGMRSTGFRHWHERTPENRQ